MDALLAILIGIGLAAACGFRVFVPLFVLSLAARAGGVEVVSSFDWIRSTEATLVLGTASAAEILAYYLPWVDNVLDVIAGPAAAVAGAIVAASVLVEVPAYARWSLAIIAGGGTASLVHGATAAIRAASTATTGGIANPMVSTGEIVGASATSILALTVPVVCVALVVAFLVFAVRRAGRLLVWSTRWRR